MQKRKKGCKTMINNSGSGFECRKTLNKVGDQYGVLGKDIILGEILPRLPAKSLICCKCVSKYLKTLISSREFIQNYLCYHSRSSNDDDDLLVIPKDKGGTVLCYHLDSSTPVATFTWHRQSPVFLIGSCNGILSTYKSLLNPTTRVFSEIVTRGGLGHNRAFAFDPVNLDFKIVGFSDKRNNEAAINPRITKVYSMNANSCTTLETECPTDTVVEGWDRRGFVINYYLVHWVFWSPSLRKRRIGCFDVCNMKWTDDVLLPRYYYDPTRRNDLLYFGVLDGLLCSSFQNQIDSCFDVWVMMEYGVQDSWFKLFSIPITDNLQEGVIPVASRSKSSQVLIRKRYSSKFYWYDRADGRMSEAKFDGVPDFRRFETFMCHRSMVELPRGRLFDDGNEV